MLAIENLTKNFGARTVLNDVTYRFPEGEKVALVGANGAGKTTLLNIISGTESVDAGRILTSQGLKIGYLPQEPEPNPQPNVLEECVHGHRSLSLLKHSMDEALEALQHDDSADRLHAFEKAETLYRHAGGYSLESRASGILSGLGFSSEALRISPRSLSGGWRMRLELAKVFLNEPDVLVLDEPTNHLDLPSLVWVERYLQSFRGTLLFVSHDRALLNRLSTVTLHLSHGNLRPYKGNFDKMLEQRAIESEQIEARRQNLEKQREHLESFVERFGAKASKASQAQSKQKQIERIRALENDIEVAEGEQSLVFKLPEPPPCGREILRVKALDIGYGAILASGIQLLLEKGSRIAVIGSNGIGKSTFLKTVAGNLPPLGGQVEFGHNVKMSYFAQNQEETLNFEQTVLQNMLATRSDLGERDARKILGSFLFTGDDVFKPVKVLSGGEKARVALCRSLLHHSNFLLLDEPTNHLDMTSVEVLIEGLKSYEGSLLFVSHDRNFIDALATHIFVMLPDGRSSLFHGQLDDYRRMAVQQGFPDVLEPAKDTPKEVKDEKKGESSDEEAKQLKRDRSRLQKSVEKLEAEQAKLKKQIDDIEQQLLTIDPNNYQKAQDLNASMQGLQDRLSQHEEDWLGLAADLEKTEIRLAELGRL